MPGIPSTATVEKGVFYIGTTVENAAILLVSASLSEFGWNQVERAKDFLYKLTVEKRPPTEPMKMWSGYEGSLYKFIVGYHRSLVDYSSSHPSRVPEEPIAWAKRAKIPVADLSFVMPAWMVDRSLVNNHTKLVGFINGSNRIRQNAGSIDLNEDGTVHQYWPGSDNYNSNRPIVSSKTLLEHQRKLMESQGFGYTTVTSTVTLPYHSIGGQAGQGIIEDEVELPDRF